MFLLMGGRNPEDSEPCHQLFSLSSGYPDNLLNDNQLLEMAQDRHQWRKLVVDCSAAEGWWWWWWWWWCMRMSAHRTCLLRYSKSCIFGVRLIDVICLSHDDSTALLLVSNPSKQEVYFSILCSLRLPTGLLAYTDIAESVKAWIFFRLSFRNCKSCVYNCDDHPSFNSSLCNSHIWFTYIHKFNKLLVSRYFSLTILASRPHKNRKSRSRWLLKFPHPAPVFSPHPKYHQAK